MKLLHEENSRVREHETAMAKLKTEEMHAQSEIEKQRFEERKQVTKEFQDKLVEINTRMIAIQRELQELKENGGVDLKSIGIAISTVTMLISNFAYGMYARFTKML